jgi:hypothetical protein
LTFEVTPETAEDAYGGWWVSVYDELALDKSRASRQELDTITERKDDILQAARNVAASQPATYRDTLPTWSPTDLQYARPSSTSAGQTDRVYVKGYYRKDGTYVQPHTRSAPKR